MPPAPQEATWISRSPPANAAGKQGALPYRLESHSFLPVRTSYAVPDWERPTISVLPARDISMEITLSKSSPSATSCVQPFSPVTRSTSWSWLHLALSLLPLMDATTILLSAVFSGVTAQILWGKLMVSQAGLPSETLYP
ncbi:hypothetical protein STENM223S_06023 [Streptomyces tendae]